MGREIKFRAWDKINKILTKTFGLSDLHYTTADDGIHFGEAFACFPFYDLRDFVLMQFTGLHDKNGKEIYPQDIIKWDGGFFGGPAIGEVVEEWGSVGPCTGPNIMEYHLRLPPDEYHDKPHDLHNLWRLDQMEVIGNIHESPERLYKSTIH